MGFKYILRFGILMFHVAIMCNAEFLENIEETDVRAVKTRLTEEKEKRLLLQNDVEMMMLKLAILERKIGENNQVCTSVQADGEKGTDKSAGNENISSPKNSHISFHASFSKGFHPQFRSGETIVFDLVSTNDGNAYDPVTGVFQAPRDGTYFFSVNILTPPSKNIHAGIFTNNNEIARLYAGTRDSWSNPGSTSVITNLKMGDRVQVMTNADGHMHGAKYSVFNGMFLY